MRRADREVTDFQAITEIMRECDVCRLALNDEGYPYILPLNFGMRVEGESVMLYFHGASEGRKYELIGADPRVSFEMDCAHRLVLDEDRGQCTMEYKSVIGRGVIAEVPDGEKLDALRLLMAHYRPEGFEFGLDAVPRTRVLKLTAEALTGKIRMKKV